ncbi:co-chaperone HscB [Thalassotalea castellviae]|uniref:Co-chaperone protein HscB homolog n=1 Tax=Thalassotalea castellviae TaxID=3075612 RepID=A0ABU3A3F3_9GAMM|nr:co-chaperone HscB [Thalassotalea sp. W431]MDT0604703.1 co-chaperone HscB [Thalassotalea sp. W431]
MNYFEIFGLDISFSLDLKQLSERFQAIQKSVHPDRFTHASNQDQMLAVKKSTAVNDAYETLKNPIKRAEYILSLRGVELPSEQMTFSDNMFLMRQMELREMLAEIKFADDTDSAVFEAHQVLDTEFQQLFKAMQVSLEENTESANKVACENLRKLKFYQKLHLELDRLEEQLFDD